MIIVVDMAASQTITPAQLRDTYRQLQDRIGHTAQRVGRKPDDVLLVAVTKYASPDQIRTLVEMGHSDLGESRVQQLSQRAATLDEFLSRKRTLAGVVDHAGNSAGSASGVPTQIRWHMVGHLQRNKIKQVVPLVRLIHSVDNLRLVEEIHHFALSQDLIVDVLIQVNASGESSKFGVAPPATVHLAEQIDTMAHLRLRGLMTMAARSDDPESARPVFAQTAEIFRDIRSAKIGGDDFNLLSMGMSDDFEVAIEEGSNLIRIGRHLFGPGPAESP